MEARCKVAHIIGEFLRGGTERVVLDLLRHLDEERFEIHVLTTSSDGLSDVRREFEKHGITISAATRGLGDACGRGLWPGQAAKKLRALAGISRKLRKGSYQIVHTHGLTNNLYGRCAAVAAGSPVIITHEHNMPEDTRRDRVLWSLLNRKTARNLTVSQTVGDRRAALVPSCREKLITLSNGIDLSEFRPPRSTEREGARARLGVTGGEWVVGTVGRLVPWKRVDLYLAAAARLLEASGTARFLVVGDGDERGRLQKMANTLGIADSVRFTGWISPREALWAMDLYAVTSGEEEGFGLATVEAMACGVPIVAVDTPLNREIVSESCGHFVRHDADSLARGWRRMLDDRAVLGAVGDKAARRARERFDIRRAGEELGAIYEELVRVRDRRKDRAVQAGGGLES